MTGPVDKLSGTGRVISAKPQLQLPTPARFWPTPRAGLTSADYSKLEERVAALNLKFAAPYGEPAMPQQIAIGTTPTDNGAGLIIIVQIKEGENVTVLYTGTHPIGTPAMGVKDLTGFELVEVEEPTYQITRFFRDPRNASQVIKRGLTKEEAREHCSDDESSSTTCTRPENLARTAQFGGWFDGFDLEA